MKFPHFFPARPRPSPTSSSSAGSRTRPICLLLASNCARPAAALRDLADLRPVALEAEDPLRRAVPETCHTGGTWPAKKAFVGVQKSKCKHCGDCGDWKNSRRHRSRRAVNGLLRQCRDTGRSCESFTRSQRDKLFRKRVFCEMFNADSET